MTIFSYKTFVYQFLQTKEATILSIYKNKTAFKIHKKTILMLIIPFLLRDECQINQNKFQNSNRN
jgi:hypothetical protein